MFKGSGEALQTLSAPPNLLNLRNAVMPSTRPRPLEDVTVLDITTALAGPCATLILAGLGARVIKVENPKNPDSCRTNAPYLGKDGAKLVRKADDDISIAAINRLRNKLGVTLNLKAPEAKEVLADLVRKADVVVENFSRGALDRLGVGYDFAREINPRVVFCSLTGYGADTEGQDKAMDTIIQALSGVMMTAGRMGEPPVRVGVPFADLCTPLFCVIGVLTALHQAKRTGRGQFIDVSMLGVLTNLVSCEPFDLLERCGIPPRTGLTLPRLAPFGVYPTSDGYIALCAPMEGMAHALFQAMGRDDLKTDPNFATRDARVKNVGRVDALVEEFTRARTKAEVLAILDKHGVPSAEVRNPGEAVTDPRVLRRGETVPLAHPSHGATEEVYGMGIPIRFSDAEVGFNQPPPAIGEHNEAVYGGLLGYPAERIAELRHKGVI
jgi:crotonobetainyl-CoA:carnitine CoA-transferase CaiB-like acyl-CoA transferase